MSVDVLVLGLASVVRPTSVAAVYAFLSARSPTPLLVAYLVAGLALSLSVGVAAVAVVHITPPPAPVTTTGRDIADVVLGVLALGAAVWYGLRTPPDRPAPQRPAREALRRRLSQPTVRHAAVAGVATHLPGVFYLGALAAIVASRPGLVGGLLQVALYNLFWFAIPLAALASWTFHPETTRDSAARLTALVQSHKKNIVVVVFVLVGLYLLGVGLYDLLTG
ncbi:GAP family protein [Actinomycetospora endophytica]|uniref:GAP family protein n=1 Tax=Actinomycetospora endophytica TaxID=2291215 RepID=A0ABS8PBP6_9PSEU|nr:GAP family protein [Actinomycetospora endophytica]MCD2195418.1 GAP family protein [Actinomycetospora endophytica]